jgi:predicted Rossmann-fold nucleotide-binding protein
MYFLILLVLVLYLYTIIYNTNNSLEKYENRENLVLLGSVSIKDNHQNENIYREVNYFIENIPRKYNILSTNSISGIIGYILHHIENKDINLVTTYTSDKLRIPLNHKYRIKNFSSDDRFENHLIDDGHIFIVFPGGIGTIYELMFVLFHILEEDSNKKLYILNVDGYYDLLLQQLEQLFHRGIIGVEMLYKFKQNVIISKNMRDILSKL